MSALAVETITNGTGRRKNAVARVRLVAGTGKITVNGKPANEYFPRQALQTILEGPFAVANVQGRYDIIATVSGGGVAGQAGAVRHGIARALAHNDEAAKTSLHKEGLLTRDPRMKERKKYGRKRARKGHQYSKQ